MELIHGRPQTGARGCMCTSLDDLIFLQPCAIAVIKINAGAPKGSSELSFYGELLLSS